MIRKLENGVSKITRLVLFLCCMDKGLCSDIMLDSYDCENSLLTNLVPTPCITGLKNESMVMEGFHLIYYSEQKQVRTGFRCTIHVKLETWYCGASSHIHLLDVPKTYMHILNKQECMDAYEEKRVKLFGIIYEVNLNETEIFENDEWDYFIGNYSRG